MTTPSGSLPNETRLGRTALRTADRAELVAFYRDVVGLDVLSESGSTTSLGVDETVLVVVISDEDARPRDRREAGLFHTAFRVPGRAALGDALARIRDRWRLEGASDHGFSEALYLSDPDGNGVEIYRDRPRAEWPRADDGSYVAPSEPLDLDGIAAEVATEAASTAPPETDVGHVHLEVSSIDAARAFYVEALGFDAMITNGSSMLFVSAGGYHHHVGLNTWKGRTQSIADDSRGLAWFEVVVPDAAVATIRERLESEELRETDDERGFAVADPDGIGVRIVSGE
ncbi:VOC family protein [Natrarchaeobius chitinivorans]|uniref:VOC family protein n=1 Tax=Natrarchaeobius chitinivorans TaxID=1679083 RepID=A0A3N6N270_NATCH|nr:VOC family protein [Natrarchaeobius chitinivorans]RQG92112.1 VOC family protein [Natrarchaeobius chitinivorans]